jgi:sulfoacetate-CoA ligase
MTSPVQKPSGGVTASGGQAVERDGARTVREVIDRMATLRGEAPFLIAPGTGRAVTFAQLRDRSRALAGRLAARGVAGGEREALLLDSGLFAVEAVLGTLYAGRVPVPLNPDAAPSEVARTVSHSDARLVFIASRCVGTLDGEISRARPVEVVHADPDDGPD